MCLVVCYFPRVDSIWKLLWSALTQTQEQAISSRYRQLAKVVKSHCGVDQMDKEKGIGWKDHMSNYS